jgi:hypothetical protein
MSDERVIVPGCVVTHVAGGIGGQKMVVESFERGRDGGAWLVVKEEPTGDSYSVGALDLGEEPLDGSRDRGGEGARRTQGTSGGARGRAGRTAGAADRAGAHRILASWPRRRRHGGSRPRRPAPELSEAAVTARFAIEDLDKAIALLRATRGVATGELRASIESLLSRFPEKA